MTVCIMLHDDRNFLYNGYFLTGQWTYLGDISSIVVEDG